MEIRIKGTFITQGAITPVKKDNQEVILKTIDEKNLALTLDGKINLEKTVIILTKENLVKALDLLINITP